MFRLTWRLLLLLSLAASCAVAWAWTHSATRSESIFVRGWGRYVVAVSSRSRVMILRVDGDPAARPAQPWYGYTPAGAADDAARQIQAGPAVFDLFPARQKFYGPITLSSGIAQSTIPPPAIAATPIDTLETNDPQATHRPHNSALGAARPAFTYDAISTPHSIAIACLALPLALHVFLLRRRGKQTCPPCRPDNHSRTCQVCGAKVD